MDEPSAGNEAGARPALTPRQVRARRRRRRRRLGVAIFLVVAIAILGAAYLAIAGSDDSSNASNTTTPSTDATTTTEARPAGPYRVTTGVNVRQGPGTNFPTVATITTGEQVFASCVTDGAPVDGPTGPVTKWLRLTGSGPVGYLTVAYVDTGDDLNVQGKIPVCAA